MYDVSKVIISLRLDADLCFLMSAKQKPGSVDHGKLEFLGGRLDLGETAHEAILRELKEEETTGHLYQLAADSIEAGPELITGDAHHHMFSLGITIEDYQLLTPHPAESLGFRLVQRGQLQPGRNYTAKTNLILTVLVDRGELTV